MMKAVILEIMLVSLSCLNTITKPLLIFLNILMIWENLFGEILFI